MGNMYRSVAIMWAIAVTWALALGHAWIALSVTLGMLLGTLILASFDWIVRRVFVPGASRPRRALALLAAVKYPAIGVLLYFLVRWEVVNLFAFVGGITLVHLAVLAKLAGIRMVEVNKERAAVGHDALANGGEI